MSAAPVDMDGVEIEALKRQLAGLEETLHAARERHAVVVAALTARCVELRVAEITAAGFTSDAARLFAAAEERRWIARHITEVGP